jgi:hypothetical protein
MLGTLDLLDEKNYLTITLSDGSTITSFKNYLITNFEYFKLLNEENLLNKGYLTVNDDPALIQILFSIIHYRNIEHVNIDNLHNILKLMDKYLLLNEFSLLFNFARLNIKTIITNYINNDNIDEIVSLYNIFVNLLELEYHKTDEYNIITIIHKICNTYYKHNDNIFIFPTFYKFFTLEQIFHSVKKHDRYEMLNVGYLDVSEVLDFLEENDKISKDTKNTFNSNYARGHKKHNTRLTRLITSYYPTFNYIHFQNINIQITSISKNIVTFTTSYYDFSSLDYINTYVSFEKGKAIEEYFTNGLLLSDKIKMEYLIPPTESTYRTYIFCHEYTLSFDKDVEDGVNFDSNRIVMTKKYSIEHNI